MERLASQAPRKESVKSKIENEIYSKNRDNR